MPSNTPTAGHNTNHNSEMHKVNHHGHGSRNTRPGSLLTFITATDPAAAYNSGDSLSDDNVVKGIEVEVTEVFDGAATLQIGDGTTVDLFQASGVTDLTALGTTATVISVPWVVAAGPVVATIGGAPTQGSATIRVVYED